MRRNIILIAALAASLSGVRADNLPPGHHTQPPKFWPGAHRRVTNFTPLEFGGRITALTVGYDHDLWFALGSTLQHVWRDGHTSSYPMPAREWVVGGVTTGPNRSVWFSAGQSGRYGMIDASGHYHFAKLVPRANFPDIRAMIFLPNHVLWFLDVGRLSIGRRTPQGSVQEWPLPKGASPEYFVACGGSAWLSYESPNGPTVGSINGYGNLRSRVLPFGSSGRLTGMACDARDRLWVTFTYYPVSHRPRLPRLVPKALRGERHFPPRGDLVMPNAALGFLSKSGTYVPVRIDATYVGTVASDQRGGVWVASSFGTSFDYNKPLRLSHITANLSATAVRIPSVISPSAPLAVNSDDVIWLGVNEGNSPIAVTRLVPSGH